jgi:hypothetical protein
MQTYADACWRMQVWGLLGSRVILSVARAAGVAGRSTSNAFYAQTPDTVVSRAEPPTRADEKNKTETHSIALIRARTLRDEGLTRAKAYRNTVLELLQARILLSVYMCVSVYCCLCICVSAYTAVCVYVCSTECSSCCRRCCRRAALSTPVYCCLCISVSSYCYILIYCCMCVLILQERLSKPPPAPCPPRPTPHATPAHIPQPTQPFQVTLQQAQHASAGSIDFADNNSKATTSDSGKHSGAAHTFENFSTPGAPRVRPVAAGRGGGDAPTCRSSSSEIASADMSRNTLLGEDVEIGGGGHALKWGDGAVWKGAAPQQTRILSDMYTAFLCMCPRTAIYVCAHTAIYVSAGAVLKGAAAGGPIPGQLPGQLPGQIPGQIPGRGAPASGEETWSERQTAADIAQLNMLRVGDVCADVLEQGDVPAAAAATAAAAGATAATAAAALLRCVRRRVARCLFARLRGWRI